MRVMTGVVLFLKLVMGGWMILLTSSELVLKVLVIFFMTTETWASYWSIFWANAFFCSMVGIGVAFRADCRATTLAVMAFTVVAAAVAFS